MDDALVMDTKEEIFEMNNGCICCTGASGAWAGWLPCSRLLAAGARVGAYGSLAVRRPQVNLPL